MSKHIRKEDKVVVIAGNDKGVVGNVVSFKGDTVLVKGVNVKKKHMKARKEGEESQIIEIEKPIHISNVALCDANGNAVKTVIEFEENGAKSLYSISKDGTKTLLRVLKKGK